MIVMKFGGTSVESAAAMSQVIEIVRSRQVEQPIVVASAMAKMTDTLLQAAYFAREGKEREAGEVLDERLRPRHRVALRELVREEARFHRVSEQLEALLGEVTTLIHGIAILREATPRTLDAVASYGERMSTLILTAGLEERGLPAELIDARRIIRTDAAFMRAQPLMSESVARAERELGPVLHGGAIPVTQGFIGETADGSTTTLGRGGSDYSAAIIGALIGANSIEIWTDVDGVMTCDPRVIPTARVLPEITFDEASELAYFGAKVLHPSTILPAVQRNIPVVVLNTKNPNADGTRIVAALPTEERTGVRAIAFKKGISVINISSTRMLLAYGFLKSIFEVFDRHKTSVDLVSTSEVSVSLTIDDSTAINSIVQELSSFAEVTVERERAIVCLVGEGMKYTAGIAARIFGAIRDMNIHMISQGASEINLSLIVSESDATEVVRRLHRELFGL